MNDEKAIEAIKQQHHRLRIAEEECRMAVECQDRAGDGMESAMSRLLKARAVLSNERYWLAELIREGIVEPQP